MPTQKVLWLPDFLRDSRPARVGLGVLVPPKWAEALDNPEYPDRAWLYLEAWKEKVRELVKKVKKYEGHLEVCRIVDCLGPQVADQYLPGDEKQEELIDMIRQAPEVSLAHILGYLRDPSPANKQDLLDHYSQSPEDHLSPQQELQEQKDLNLDEFLLSL